MEFKKLAVCEDCYMFVAGYSADERGIEYPDAVIGAFERDAPYYVFVNDSDEPYFGTSQCQQCGSHLAGDRHIIGYARK